MDDDIKNAPPASEAEKKETLEKLAKYFSHSKVLDIDGMKRRGTRSDSKPEKTAPEKSPPGKSPKVLPFPD